MSEPILDVLPPELRAYADAHGVTAGQLKTWAAEDLSFPAVYLRTHGMASVVMYTRLLAHYLTRRIAGDTFAEANTQTATALRTSAQIFEANDTEAGNVVSDKS